LEYHPDIGAVAEDGYKGKGITQAMTAMDMTMTVRGRTNKAPVI